MKHIVIGIDPDVTQSGIARVDKEQRKAWATSLPFPLLLDYLKDVKKEASKEGAHLSVYVESSHLITHNWHINRFDKSAVVAAKGRSVGAVHQVGKLIIEMCHHIGIEVHEQLPFKKCWKGIDGKITHEEITHICQWSKKRSNQEVRDAMLIAWTCAGLPLKIKTN